MLNTTEVLIDAFMEQVQASFRRNYGTNSPELESILAWVGNMALENIANSDALYHDVEHTILVTLVGQEILRGKHIREGGVTRDDWFHFIVSLLCHDIGYVRGVCWADRDGEFATGRNGKTVKLSADATDAALTPYHVDRGKLFVAQRFSHTNTINVDVVKRNIELTRFPVPKAGDHDDTQDYPGLVRASDLIGQLSDPRYLQKINRLYLEFAETGVNEELGYKSPTDLREHYPSFFWNSVHPFIKDALVYLDCTQQGKQIIANLYANVFVVEHEAKARARGDVKSQK